MATEQEELKLILTLVDNITPGIDKVRKSIQDLGEGGGGGGAPKHIEKINEGAKALTETLIRMTGSFGEAIKSLGMLRLGFLGGIAGVAAFGYEMKEQMNRLTEYADKVRDIGQVAKNIGVDRNTIKNIADQLGVYGPKLQEVEQYLTKFVTRMSELRRDPRLNMQILQQTDIAQQPAMRKRLEDLERETDLYKQLEKARQLGIDVERNAAARIDPRTGRPQGQAIGAEVRRKFMEQYLGYNPELGAADELEPMGAGRRRVLDQANKEADHLSETWGKIKSLQEDIENIQMRMWTKIISGPLEAFKNLLERFTGAAEKGEEEGITSPRQAYRQWLENTGRIKPKGDFNSRWPNPNEQLTPWEGAPPQILQKQSYRGLGVEGNPLLHQAGFQLEDHQKGIDANTDQLKQLNDLLRSAMGLGGGAGGGGGFQNAAYTPGGGGGGRGFGGGGYSVVPEGGAVPRALGGGGGGGGGGDATVDRGAAGAPRMTQSKRQVAQIAADALRKGGMSESMIAGVFANIADESAFNPNTREFDQPGYARRHPGSEGSYAHGLYQEGAEEWNNYSAWLAKNHPDGNWRDPSLQSEFLAKNLKENYPGLWKRMQNAKSPGEAAQLFVKGYLKPAAGPMASRMGKYGRGVPGVGAYTGGDQSSSIPAAEPQQNAIEAVPWLKDYGQYREEQDKATFRSPILSEQSLLDSYRRRMDEENGATKVEGTGKLSVHVNAPKGTDVSAAGGGLFKDVKINRQTQMDKAEKGPELSSGMPLP
jgi:hypothetical protein